MFSKDSKAREGSAMDEMLVAEMMTTLGFLEMDQLSLKTATLFSLSGNTLASPDPMKGVQEMYKLQQQNGLRPKLEEKPKKSNEESQKLRIKGNEAYKAGDLMEALGLYTRAICCAKPETEEIAKAYANRSAVTYGLEEYQNCINDVTRALSTGKYPTILSLKLLERRGKCFLVIGQYKRAKEDSERLITLITQMEVDNEKLNSMMASHHQLMTECMGKQDIPRKLTVKPPKLSHEPSPYIQCASAAVDIHFSPKMGRGVVATVDIAPGDILAIEKPFASILKRECWELFCHHCKKRCHSSIPCTSCVEVVFCSDLCRETSWAEYHSVECDILHHLKNLGCEPAHFLVLRTIMKTTTLGQNLQMYIDENFNDAKKLEGPRKSEKAALVSGMYKSDHYATVNNLMTHANDYTATDLTLMWARICTIIYILKEATTFFDPTNSGPSSDQSELQLNHITAAVLLKKYLMMRDCNAYSMGEINWKRKGDQLEADLKEIGLSIFPFLSLQNHSCDPNSACAPYNGDTFVMFATRPIFKGQEIFASYGPEYTAQNKKQRQATLRRESFFTCECTACLEDWPTLDGIPDEFELVSGKAEKDLQRELQDSMHEYSKHFEDFGNFEMMASRLLEVPLTENAFQALIKLSTLTYKYVKCPCKSSYEFRKAIRQHMLYSFNPYILKEIDLK